MNAELLKWLRDEHALGLLEGDERAQLEALLTAQDEAALAQMRESTEFVAQVALLAPPVEPPALGRSQVMNGVKGAAPTAETAAASPSANVAVMPVRSRRAWAAGWAAAAALGLFSLYFFWALRAAQAEIEETNRQLASVRQENDRSRKILAVVLSRDARYIKMSTAEQEPMFRAFWGGQSGLVLVGANVPKPAAGRTLQLWVVPKGAGAAPVSAGVFAPGVDGQVLLIAETALQPDGAAALAISDEPAGGSPAPTTKPVFVDALGD
ncbi:MAG: hypothetical protein FJW31_30190 [Acidobacteria bacterium]|nr:hypothetical protein [Acidobacteriota bacterium]